MNVIRNDIHALIKKELRGANERFPLFASLHEAIAVIAEERDEAADELKFATSYLSYAWVRIKMNDDKAALEFLSKAKEAAERLAIEACQLSAMCEKAAQSAANVKQEDSKC